MLIFSDLPNPFTNVKLAHVLLYLEQIFSISVYNKLLTVSSLRVMPSTETTADLTKTPCKEVRSLRFTTFLIRLFKKNDIFKLIYINRFYNA